MKHKILRPGVTTVMLSLLVVLGSVAAYLADLRFWPSAMALAAVALLFTGIQRSYQEGDSRRSNVPLRTLSLVACFLLTTLMVHQTGGSGSAFTGVLFFPILMAALSFGLGGSVAMGLLVSTTFLVSAAFDSGSWIRPSNAVIVQVITFTLVALASGTFADGLHRAADEAAERARAQEERASETEAFLDTSVMMESMYDLENTLAVALIRLSELVPADVCAVFLRDTDGNHLQLNLLTGMPGDTVPVRTLPLDEDGTDWQSTFVARHWADASQDAAGLGALTGLDESARGVIVAPLRTLEDFFGLIYVAARGKGVLTERHRDLVGQFARHVVFPIQRLRLQQMAATDVMTGLDNHRSFRIRLSEEVRRAYRYGHSVSLILLDIDFFKKFNDTYGHQAGDALLGQMGTLLRKSLRSFDIPARYGGEEMAVILPETSPEDARMLGERIRATVEQNRFQLPEGGEVHLTVSVGVATLPSQAPSEATLIAQADKALFVAKREGRNTVRVATDTVIGALVL